MRTGHVHVVPGEEWRFDLLSPGEEKITLFFERRDQPLVGAPPLEPAIVGSLLYWMREGVDEVRVHGPLSKTLMNNLDELQAVWQKWRRQTYRRVEVVPDDMVDDVPTGQGAVAAFSGGVDASYTVFRHVVRPAGEYLVDLAECVMVQGFDIGLDEDPVFDRALARAEKQLAGTGLPLAAVRTNLKRDVVRHWEDEFGLCASAVLLTFSATRRCGLLGSSEPYDALVLPWGSTPVQDWMASTGALQIRHDGAGRSRSEKVAELTGWPSSLDHLRVCWKGEEHDRNCGRCEKCLRTMLNFLSVGHPIPACFDDELDLGRVRHLRLASPAVVTEFDAITRTAEDHGITDPWVETVRALVRRQRRPPSRARRAWRRGRAMLTAKG